MKLRDIEGVETYLEEDCYRPYRVYDLSGFVYECFNPDDECEIIYRDNQEDPMMVLISSISSMSGKRLLLRVWERSKVWQML